MWRRKIRDISQPETLAGTNHVQPGRTHRARRESSAGVLPTRSGCIIRKVDSFPGGTIARAHFGGNLGLRIDHMWVTQPLLAGSINTWIDIRAAHLGAASDHAPVVAEFA